MASQGITSPSGNTMVSSRLSQMQMRFQQKQQQERAQRRIEMTGPSATYSSPDIATNGSPKVSATESDTAVGNGKVRQMFHERRRGIDRSHPLKPIVSPQGTTTTVTTTTTSTTRTNQKATTLGRSVGATTPKATTQARKVPPPAAVAQRRVAPRTITTTITHSGGGDGIDQLDNGHILTQQFSGMSVGDGLSIGDRNNNHNHTAKDTNGNAHEHYNSREEIQSNGVTLKPVVMKKSSVGVDHQRSSPRTGMTGSGSAGRAQRVSGTPSSLAPKQSGPMGKPPPGMEACVYCKRHFNADRLEKHVAVCDMGKTRRRKIFDSTKHRVQGTDAEKYVLRNTPPNRAKAVTQQSLKSVNRTAVGTSKINAGTAGGEVKKNNWRQKHEEFIAAIRAAKQMQAYVARGGKLSDLPPPPRSENPDYIQCPHCLRRFNETAANRHIPKCATMLHNKPKPGQQPKRR